MSHEECTEDMKGKKFFGQSCCDGLEIEFYRLDFINSSVLHLEK
jgi:hypothetical protein